MKAATSILSGSAILALAVAAAPMAASAHAHIVSANPAPNATVSAAPKALQLSFNEAVLPKLSTVQLAQVGGAAVHIGDTVVDPKDKKKMSAPLHGDLAPGAYKVSWSVVSADSHKMKGDYTFTVKR